MHRSRSVTYWVDVQSVVYSERNRIFLIYVRYIIHMLQPIGAIFYTRLTDKFHNIYLEGTTFSPSKIVGLGSVRI